MRDRFKLLPKWLKVILTIISIITVVYWVFLVIFKLLCAIRVIGEFIFEKRNYWTFVCVMIIIAISTLLIGEFYFGLQPFEKIAQWCVEKYDAVIDSISNWIVNRL